MQPEDASVNAIPVTDVACPHTMPECTWGDAYRLRHRELSLKASNDRAARRLRDRERPRKAVQEGTQQPPTASEMAMVEVVAGQHRSKAALVSLRINRGFVWTGGLVGDNPAYRRPAFVHQGLVSDEHPVLALFTSKLPRAKNLRTGDTKARSDSTDSKMLALDSPYVEGNKRVAGFVCVDMDGAMTWEEVAAACQEARVPLPNVAVGYLDVDGRFLSPHLIWMLAASVPMTEGVACKRFRGIYHAVARGLVKALLPWGADPGGLLNAFRVKNPLSPLWNRRILAEEPYDLSFLAKHVDGTIGVDRLKRMHAAIHGDDVAGADHPDPDMVAESNRFFSELAGWARREVGRHRKAGVSEDEFGIVVTLEACELAARMTGDAIVSERGARVVARTVAGWTWNKYRGRAPRRKTADDVELLGRRAAAGRVGGPAGAATRSGRSQDAIVSAAVRLAEIHGRRPTQIEVLAAARGPGCTNEKTVRRHWPAVLEALAA